MVPRVGIIGLDQAGKTTLFRILTHSHGGASAMSRPETRLGAVRVPDARLDKLSEVYRPQKTVYASINYLDTPGSVIELARTGAQAAALREVGALAHVVRAFDEASRSPDGSSGLRGNIENVEIELMLSDLAVVEKRLERLEKDRKKQKDPALDREYQVLLRCKSGLEKQSPLRELSFSAEESRVIRGFTFFSLKPMLYVLNLSETDSPRTESAEEFARETGLKQRPRTQLTAISGKVEEELTALSEAEAAELLASYGLKEPAITRLIRACYRLLDLVSFFTIDGNECRAWTIRRGTTALEAAGEVHSDIQKGFIRAEVVRFDDLVQAGSLAEARNRATLRLEGKDYVVQDGEVVHFRHSG